MDFNGGSVVEYSTTFTNTDQIVLPTNSVKNGYTFAGWYKTLSFQGAPITIVSLGTEEDQKFYAKWDIISYTITYYANEGLMPTNPINNFTIEESVILPIPTRSGYEFLGWYEESDFTGNKIENIQIGTFSSKTFYANWREIIYVNNNVTFALNGGLLDANFVEQKFTSTSSFSILRYNTGSGSGANIAIGSKSSVTSAIGQYWNKIFIKYDTTIKAYVIIAIDSSGKGLSDYASLDYDYAIGVHSACTDTIGSAVIINISKNSSNIGNVMVFDCDLSTLSSSTINVVAKLYSASIFINNFTLTYRLSAELPIPSRAAYVFMGWYSDITCNTKVNSYIASEEANSFTLYAKWELYTTPLEQKQALIDSTISEIENQFYTGYLYENAVFSTFNSTYQTTITWTSSNTAVLSNSGVISRSSIDQYVNVTVLVVYEGVQSTIELTFRIAKNGLKDISTGGIVSAYVYNGTYANNKVNDLLLGTVDIIYSGFALPTADGGITLSTSYKNSLNDYLVKAHNAGVRVLLCIGQEGDAYRANFSTIANDNALTATFVSNIITLINQYGFDGVDIDWEYPATAEKDKYTYLMQQIHTAVKANNINHLVTSAIPAGPWSYSRFDLANSIQYLDYINLMSYDLQCQTTNGTGGVPVARHHSALYSSNNSNYSYTGCSIDESVNLFKNQGVPYNKIIIGAAFYARYSTVTTAGASGAGLGGAIGDNGLTDSKSGATMTYTNIKNNYINNFGETIKRYWDDNAKAPYIYDSARQIFISYDDAMSVGYKCDYVMTKGVAGIMYWDNGSDSTGDLLKAINGKLSVLKSN